MCSAGIQDHVQVYTLRYSFIISILVAMFGNDNHYIYQESQINRIHEPGIRNRVVSLCHML